MTNNLEKQNQPNPVNEVAALIADHEPVLLGLPIRLALVHPNLTICWASPALIRDLEHGPDDIIGKYIAAVAGCEDYHINGPGQSNCCRNCQFCLSLQKVFADGYPIWDRETILAGCHRLKWIQFSISRLELAGKPFAAISFTDITADKNKIHYLEQLQNQLNDTNRQLQESLEQNRIMAAQSLQASKTKSQFLANMSHEIRTPLNGMLGFCELLINESLNETQLDYVQTIQSCGQNLMQVVNDILDLTRIEAGKIQIKIESCKLKKLFNEILQMFKPRADEKNISFEINIMPNVPDEIRTDTGRLRQCLINVIGNALKFTDGGSVRIDVLPEGEQSIRIDVTDTGIGIQVDKQELIFDLFTQADESFTRRYDGAGLGLAITRQLLDLIGGRISLRSAVGTGSTFTLIVPSHKPQNQHEAHRPTRRSPIHHHDPHHQLKGRVLVVEDNVHNLRLLSILLRRLNLDVTTATNGQQVLNMVQNDSWDLILMDMELPVMSGFEAVTLLRQQGVTTPIVALTAHAMAGDRQRCLNAGCDNYLTKPLKQDALYQLLLKYLAESIHGQAESRNPVTPLPSPHSQTSEQIISTLADDADLACIAQMFLNSLPDMIEKIQAYADSSCLDDLIKVAHDLKGSSGNAGFEPLYHKGLALENAAKIGAFKQINSLLDDIRSMMPHLSATRDQEPI